MTYRLRCYLTLFTCSLACQYVFTCRRSLTAQEVITGCKLWLFWKYNALNFQETIRYIITFHTKFLVSDWSKIHHVHPTQILILVSYSWYWLVPNLEWPINLHEPVIGAIKTASTVYRSAVFISVRYCLLHAGFQLLICFTNVLYPITSPKKIQFQLSNSIPVKMVFIILKIVANLAVMKDWFGFKYNDTNNLLDLYNDFTSWSIDKAAPVAQSARIRAYLQDDKKLI